MLTDTKRPDMSWMTYPVTVVSYLCLKLLQLVARQKLITLQVFVDCLLNNVLRERPIMSLIGFEPVPGELFVEGRLAVTRFISFSRPETRAVRGKHLITKNNVSFFVQTEFKLGICNDDTAG